MRGRVLDLCRFWVTVETKFILESDNKASFCAVLSSV